MVDLFEKDTDEFIEMIDGDKCVMDMINNDPNETRYARISRGEGEVEKLKEDIDRISTHLNKSKIVGYVVNLASVGAFAVVAVSIYLNSVGWREVESKPQHEELASGRVIHIDTSWQFLNGELKEPHKRVTYTLEEYANKYLIGSGIIVRDGETFVARPRRGGIVLPPDPIDLDSLPEQPARKD